MFSMNQLQQLININQTLTAAFPTAASASGSTSGGASSTSQTSGAN
jgi:hypothetical protein